MRIQPRQQLLDIWKATASASLDEKGGWRFGGRDDSNSISDAEQLLCLMTPANEIPNFRLSRPDEIHTDVLDVLKVLGGQNRLPRLLVSVLTYYHETYRVGGVPVFPGGTFFTPPDGVKITDEQRGVEVVESYSASVTLTLATIAFARGFRSQVSREDLIAEIDKLEALASERLTAALVGLLRSFSILVFLPTSEDGENLVKSVNLAGIEPQRVAESLNRDLREVRAGLLDLSTGSGTDQTTKDDLRTPNSLFQCGWSWGIVQDAPDVAFISSLGGQSTGIAIDAPYLYFTAVALDGIADLFSTRTRTLNLLDDDQQRLARALQIRWDLTQAYWAILASFGRGPRWPLEDIPWLSIDGEQSDYFTLMVTAISMTDLVERRGADIDLGRLGRILGELANRARITRRPLPGDTALQLHDPGVAIELEGTEKAGDHRLSWVAQDFGALLLKRTIRIADLLKDIELRSDVLTLADDIWQHLVQRRLSTGAPAGLWDDAHNVYPQLSRRGTQPSWHYTVRIVESLVQAAKLVSSQPLSSERLLTLAEELISEADHLFDQQLLTGFGQGPSMQRKLALLRADLERARSIVDDRPGTATVLVSEVLRELDRLAIARQDAAEVSG